MSGHLVLKSASGRKVMHFEKVSSEEQKNVLVESWNSLEVRAESDVN